MNTFSYPISSKVVLENIKDIIFKFQTNKPKSANKFFSKIPQKLKATTARPNFWEFVFQDLVNTSSYTISWKLILKNIKNIFKLESNWSEQKWKKLIFFKNLSKIKRNYSKTQLLRFGFLGLEDIFSYLISSKVVLKY